MKAFTELYSALDATTKTTAKVRALKAYFARASSEDAAWAIYFLIGRRPRQVVPSGKLRVGCSRSEDSSLVVSRVLRCGR